MASTLSGSRMASLKSSVKSLLFSSYHISSITAFMFLSSIILPLNLHELCAEHQASLMGNILALCAVFSGASSLFFGLVVDYFNSKRARFIFIAIFTVIFSVSCYALSFYYEAVLLVEEGQPKVSHCSLSNDVSLWIYILMFINAKSLFSIAHAPYYALMPVLFKADEYGRVSGFIGVGVMLGILFATGVIAAVYRSVWDSVWMIILGSLNIISLFPLAMVMFSDELGQVWKFVLRPIGKSPVNTNLDLTNQSINAEFHEKSSLLQSPSGSTLPQLGAKSSAYEVYMDDDEDASSIDENPLLPDLTSDSSPPTPNKPSLLKSLTSPRQFIHFIRESLASLLRPWKNRNFVLCFLNRFFFFSAISVSTSYQLFYIQDVLGVNDYRILFFKPFKFINSPERALSVTTFSNLISSILATVGFGYMADKAPNSRLSYVYFGTLVYSGTKAMVPLLPDFTFFLFLNMVQGIGLGAFMATGLALTSQVIKDKKKAATEFAVLSLAQFVPQLAVPMAGGYILEWGQALGKDIHFDQLGYWFIYILSGVLGIIACLVLLFFDTSQLSPPGGKKTGEADKEEDEDVIVEQADV